MYNIWFSWGYLWYYRVGIFRHNYWCFDRMRYGYNSRNQIELQSGAYSSPPSPQKKAQSDKVTCCDELKSKNAKTEKLGNHIIGNQAVAKQALRVITAWF